MSLLVSKRRHAARLYAAVRRPVQSLLEPLEGRTLFNAGQVDTAFGQNGSANDLAASIRGGDGSVIVQSTGKYVVAGTDSSPHIVLERFNADGSVDSTFGSSGIVTVPFTSGMTDAALAPGDKIVVGDGNTVYRFNADGSLDTTFASGVGYTVIQPHITQLTVQTDGKVVTVGTLQTASGTAATVERLNANGSVDTSFGNNGNANIVASYPNATLNDLVVESSGKIAVAGSNASTQKPLIIELDPNGVPTGTNFDMSTVGPGAFSGIAEDKANGGLVAVGEANPVNDQSTPADENSRALIVRFFTNGQPVFVDKLTDQTTTGFGGLFNKVAVQSDGKIIAAGSAFPIFRALYAVRVDAAGNLDHTFANYGTLVDGASSTVRDVQDITLSPTDGSARVLMESTFVGGMLTPGYTYLELRGLTGDAAPTPGDHAIPAAPSNGSVNLGLSTDGTQRPSVHITFTDNATDESGFDIQRSATLGGPYVSIANLFPAPGSGSTVTFDDYVAGAANNTVFYYRVAAINYGGYTSNAVFVGGVATPARGANPDGAPAAPSGLRINGVNSTDATLSFVDNSVNETGFVVERATSPNGPFAQVPGVTAVDAAYETGSTVTYDDNTVVPGTTYYYRTYAVNGSAQSAIVGPTAVYVPLTGERPFAGTPRYAPGVIEAEQYDLGGEGVAYHDTTTANEGGQYRPTEGVDIEALGTTGDAVDFTHTGEYLNYTTQVAGTRTYDLTFRVANYGTGAGFTVSVDGQTLPAVTIPNTNSFTNYVTVDAGNVSLIGGQHLIKITFTGQSQYGYSGNLDSFAVTAVTQPPPPPAGGSPFSGTPFSVGQQVEAENFNTGGEGVAYHDTDATNNGGQYRPTEGVDIETTTDTGGGYDVGYIHTGEYLNYTGTFSQTANYDFSARVADLGAGGSFHVNIDGKAATGTLTIPDTGGFQNWQNVGQLNIPITAGTHVVQIVFDGQSQYGFSGNLNSFKFTSSPTTAPYGGTRPNLPGLVEAEKYDIGGEGLAYHDTDATNNGGAFRPNEGVDIESIGNTGGYAVDYTHAGEWLKYSVNVTLAGTYTFDARVADYGAGAAFHVEIDGNNATGTLAVPDTGSFTTYTDVTKAGISLTPGLHTIRIVFDANSQYGFAGNLDSFRLS